MLKFKWLIQSDMLKLFNIYSDKEAMRFRGSKPMTNLEDAKRFIANQKLREGTTLTIRRGVERIENGELLGSVMFRYDDTKEGVCEIGYSIGKQYWGKGLGTEIVKEILKTLQKDHNIQTAIAWSHKQNIASIKILKSLGFTRTPQRESEVNHLFTKQLAQACV